MGDIQKKILNQYGLDIVQEENIFKLYKISGPEISNQDLAKRIQETRKKWDSSINGSNEKFAERDRARLEKADRYEAILKDAAVRKELFAFYNASGGKKDDKGSTAFAKEYFELVATTKKIKKTDVEFFFEYYQSERKNKKAILDMLSKEMKITGLGKEDKYADADEKEENAGKKGTDKSSPLIVNLFQKATVLEIRKALEKYNTASQSEELCQRYPKLREGLFSYLEIEDVTDAKQLEERMSQRGKEVFARRQEEGSAYLPLVDLFNLLQKLASHQDVADNIPEFKLLLKYPDLTPYMFAFVEMKPNTVQGMLRVANKGEAAFRNETDFFLNYYKPVHDNFGISDRGIRSQLRAAEKKAKQNKVLNHIDQVLGAHDFGYKLLLVAEVIHWLVYWPIFILYFIFEVAKTVFMNLHWLTVPNTILMFVLSNWWLPKWFEKADYPIGNLFSLRKIIFKTQWFSYMEQLNGAKIGSGSEFLMVSVLMICFHLILYILPAVLAFFLTAGFADDFNKKFDWVGIERTFQSIFMKSRKKTKAAYDKQKNSFVGRQIPKILTNVLCVIMIPAMIHFIPIGLHRVSEYTGYGQDNYAYETEEEAEEEDMQTGETMVITADSANIRSGPGTDYEVIATAGKGAVFVATGNQETADNGRIWYEVLCTYGEDGTLQPGWASEKVIDFEQ